MTRRRVLIRDLGPVLAALGVLIRSANGQNEPDEKVYDLGPGVTPPRVTKQVNPHYSTAHGIRVDGSVIIALVVSSKGIPKDLRVVKGLDKDVDQSALNAVQEWRFAPALKDGQPVAVRISLEIAFHSM